MTGANTTSNDILVAAQPPPSTVAALACVDGSSAAARNYLCQCGRPIFFGNSRCLACGCELGYVVPLHRLLPLAAAGGDHWQVHPSMPGVRGEFQPLRFQRCANFQSPSGCNWMVELDELGYSATPWCQSCRLNRTIPDLGLADNALLWARIETAKRRVVSSLLAMGLPVQSRLDQDPQRGVMFDFLRGVAGAGPVLTGHEDGLITLDIDEADDLYREQRRQALHEPYRSLLGHLRHELGHYYWTRLVEGSALHEDFRRLFGDESVDYQTSLQRYYAQPPQLGWNERYISAYASMHPWEDWAETWAHYLHMNDAVDTAQSFGIHAAAIELPMEGFGCESLYWPQADDADRFLVFINDWVKLTGALNELSRSMGQPDFYPFVLPHGVVGKLQFIHRVVHDAGRR